MYMMTNVIRANQERRALMVLQIQKSIQLSLESNPELKFQELVLATMANLNLSRPTARDYIDVALFNLNIDKAKLK